ncbi:phospholipase A2-like [Leptopilina heterotoma]|uniref:phospholipase A2-like n=1 Tax=Leptopilina heterotoma TaxID=63436 RepID=UPI001CA9A260|nr:phospholipase A2-like [Leptopilina heterotoma]
MSGIFNLLSFNYLFFTSISSVEINFIKDYFNGPAVIGTNFVYPGTKWCGKGNVAFHYNDLGKYAKTDACCRDHDHCNDVIHSTETKYNLTNLAPFTRVHCSCEEKFYNCLQQSRDKVGSKMGILYFNILDTKCFRKDHPIRGCKRYSRYRGRCVVYDLDEGRSMIHQWFDVLPFRK